MAFHPRPYGAGGTAMLSMTDRTRVTTCWPPSPSEQEEVLIAAREFLRHC